MQAVAGFEPDLLGAGRGPDGVERTLHDRLEIDGAYVEAHLAADYSRHIEQIINELNLCVGVSDDGVEGAGP